MATKVASTTMIGPESWRNSTLKGIKLSQNIVHKSDKSCDIGRAFDPLPHLRDTVVQLSNEEIRRYTRDVRAVVAKLRESLLETNEEIKSLTRGKEALEKALEHTRKDLKLNKDSNDVRLSRHTREKVRKKHAMKKCSLYYYIFHLVNFVIGNTEKGNENGRSIPSILASLFSVCKILISCYPYHCLALFINIQGIYILTIYLSRQFTKNILLKYDTSIMCQVQ